MVATLATDGYPSAVLWVVSENARARAFYEAEGWIADGTERDAEVRYHRLISGGAEEVQQL